MAGSDENQLIAIANQLNEMVADGRADDTVAILRNLGDEDISLRLLKKTQIGRAVNNVRRGSSKEEVVALAKKIVNKWRRSATTQINSVVSETGELPDSQMSQMTEETETSQSQQTSGLPKPKKHHKKKKRRKEKEAAHTQYSQLLVPPSSEGVPLPLGWEMFDDTGTSLASTQNENVEKRHKHGRDWKKSHKQRTENLVSQQMQREDSKDCHNPDELDYFSRMYEEKNKFLDTDHGDVPPKTSCNDREMTGEHSSDDSNSTRLSDDDNLEDQSKNASEMQFNIKIERLEEEHSTESDVPIATNEREGTDNNRPSSDQEEGTATPLAEDRGHKLHVDERSLLHEYQIEMQETHQTPPPEEVQSQQASFQAEQGDKSGCRMEEGLQKASTSSDSETDRPSSSTGNRASSEHTTSERQTMLQSLRTDVTQIQKQVAQIEAVLKLLFAPLKQSLDNVNRKLTVLEQRSSANDPQNALPSLDALAVAETQAYPDWTATLDSAIDTSSLLTKNQPSQSSSQHASLPLSFKVKSEPEDAGYDLATAHQSSVTDDRFHEGPVHREIDSSPSQLLFPEMTEEGGIRFQTLQEVSDHEGNKRTAEPKAGPSTEPDFIPRKKVKLDPDSKESFSTRSPSSVRKSLGFEGNFGDAVGSKVTQQKRDAEDALFGTNHSDEEGGLNEDSSPGSPGDGVMSGISQDVRMSVNSAEGTPSSPGDQGVPSQDIGTSVSFGEGTSSTPGVRMSVPACEGMLTSPDKGMSSCPDNRTLSSSSADSPQPDLSPKETFVEEVRRKPQTPRISLESDFRPDRVKWLRENLQRSTIDQMIESAELKRLLHQNVGCESYQEFGHSMKEAFPDVVKKRKRVGGKRLSHYYYCGLQWVKVSKNLPDEGISSPDIGTLISPSADSLQPDLSPKETFGEEVRRKPQTPRISLECDFRPGRVKWLKEHLQRSTSDQMIKSAELKSFLHQNVGCESYQEFGHSVKDAFPDITRKRKRIGGISVMYYCGLEWKNLTGKEPHRKEPHRYEPHKIRDQYLNSNHAYCCDEEGNT